MYGVLISVVANAIILKYVLENERNNCECALTWHHNFIKLYAPVVIFLSFAKLLFKDEINKSMNKPLFRVIFGLLGVVSLAYSITLIIYFFKLQRESNCDCSKDWKRNVLAYPLVIVAIVILIVIFITIAMSMAAKKGLKK
jgi:hypothetical protein